MLFASSCNCWRLSRSSGGLASALRSCVEGYEACTSQRQGNKNHPKGLLLAAVLPLCQSTCFRESSYGQRNNMLPKPRSHFAPHMFAGVSMSTENMIEYAYFIHNLWLVMIHNIYFFINHHCNIWQHSLEETEGCWLDGRMEGSLDESMNGATRTFAHQNLPNGFSPGTPSKNPSWAIFEARNPLPRAQPRRYLHMSVL